MNFKIAYVTCASLEQAESIATKALKQQLAACANILPGMTSLYWWDKEIEKANEWVLLLKTTADCVDSLQKLVVQEHDYQCPCVLILDIESGHPDYLQWLSDHCLSGT